MPLEIIAVFIAILILFLSGVALVRSALGFGKTVGKVMGDVEPKVNYLIEQSDAAQRRSISITEGRDNLLRRLFVLQVSIAKLRVILSAAREAWRPAARALDYVGL